MGSRIRRRATPYPWKGQHLGADTRPGDTQREVRASVLQEHTYTFEDVARGTRVAVAMEAEPGGFFRIAGPRLEKTAHRQAKNELQKLKEVVQARGWPVVKQ